MFDLQVYLHIKREWIEKAIAQLLIETTFPGQLAEAMRYALMAGGKRVRPILCVAAAEAVGKIPENAVLKTACALELIHTYSLIHDDLPAMDDDVLRRGRPTCHIAFDEATAILAGDALLTLAFQTMACRRTDDEIPAGIWLRVFQHIAEAAGPKGMVEGQMRDVISEGQALTLPELQEIHRLKTGELIRASVMTGAMLAEASSFQLDQLKSYAEYIGMAFQVVDDILNIEGDQAIMGKSVGTDQVRQKITYPALIGVDASKDLVKSLVEKSLDALTEFNNNADPLRAIARYIIERKR